MTTAEIIVSLWAGTRGYLDKARCGVLRAEVTKGLKLPGFSEATYCIGQVVVACHGFEAFVSGVKVLIHTK